MLTLNIMEVHVANGVHNGVVRLYCDRYMNERAQAAINDIIASNKDIEDATLLAEQQVIIIEAAKPIKTEATLKKYFYSFNNAVIDWYNSLDEVDLGLLSYHPNHRRDAHLAYSGTHADYEWSELQT